VPTGGMFRLTTQKGSIKIELQLDCPKKYENGTNFFLISVVLCKVIACKYYFPFCCSNTYLVVSAHNFGMCSPEAEFVGGRQNPRKILQH
jgi:hypothetical protein